MVLHPPAEVEDKERKGQLRCQALHGQHHPLHQKSDSAGGKRVLEERAERETEEVGVEVLDEEEAVAGRVALGTTERGGGGVG